jgi:uncharacterized protein with PIN domain
VILTKDAQFMKRRLVTNGKLKAMLIKQDDPKLQVQEIARKLNLNYNFKPFSLCLECNQALLPRDKEEVQSLVPTHVLKTQTQYTECPACHRIYWQGTHWQAMEKKLQDLQVEDNEKHTSS